MNTLIASQDQPINQHSRFSSKTFLLPYCHTVYSFFSRRGARCPQSIHLDCDCVSCSLHLEYHWHSPVACTEFGQLKIKINRNKHQVQSLQWVSLCVCLTRLQNSFFVQCPDSTIPSSPLPSIFHQL